MNHAYFALSALLLCMYYQDSHTQETNVEPIAQQVRYAWHSVQYAFATKGDRQVAGKIVPNNAVAVDVQPYYKGDLLKKLVTTPRFNDGIPYTLAKISKKKNRKGNAVYPYPNYSMHNHNNGTNCDAIMSAYHVAIDECNQMWVIDDGSNGSGPTCPPKLLLFDLNTDKLVHRYHFETPLYTPGASSLFNLVLNVKDTANKCKNTMIYVADSYRHGLVVYDYNQNTAWRVENMYMYPEPNYGMLKVANESFAFMDGIFGLATDKKNLYFHPLSSVKEYSVPLQVLDNRALFENNSGIMLEEFKEVGERPAPCTASAMDSKSNLYCITLDPISLTKWNVADPSAITKSVISVNPSSLQFVGGMKVLKNPDGTEELWMVSNRFQKIMSGTVNHREPNFHIVVLKI